MSTYDQLVEKTASQIISCMEKTAASEEEGLTEDQVRAIIEAKKQAAREQAEGDDDSEEKAAAVYEYALRKAAASEEVYNDGIAQRDACIETLAEYGLINRDGSLNKEAAESSDEAADFVNKIAEIYDDAIDKIAAAQEKYAEAEEEYQAATEVLAGYGYSFE